MQAPGELATALRTWIDAYHGRSDHDRIRHSQVVTYPVTVDASAVHRQAK
jgi:hypothetical protein